MTSRRLFRHNPVSRGTSQPIRKSEFVQCMRSEVFSLELQGGDNEASDIASHLLFRAQDKNKQYHCCYLFFLFLFDYASQGNSIT